MALLQQTQHTGISNYIALKADSFCKGCELLQPWFSNQALLGTLS